MIAHLVRVKASEARPGGYLNLHMRLELEPERDGIALSILIDCVRCMFARRPFDDLAKNPRLRLSPRDLGLRGSSKYDTTSLAKDDCTECEVDGSDIMTLEASDLIKILEGLGQHPSHKCKLVFTPTSVFKPDLLNTIIS